MNKIEQHIYKLDQFGPEDYFTYKQLYTDMVRLYPSGSTFVEIGCLKGRSSAYMAVEIANSQKNIDFYCVDLCLYVPQENLLDNLAPLSNYFKFIKGPSADVAQKFENESLDFIFIDAGHEYEEVKEDINAWLPKLRKNGTLAGHDYQDAFPGVKKAAEECLETFVVDTRQKCFIYNKK